MARIQDLMPAESQGNSMLQLSETLTALGFETRGVETTYEGLLTGTLPVIAHVLPAHFLLVVEADEDGISVYDGAEGIKRTPAAEFRAAWSGKVLTVSRAEAKASGIAGPHARWKALLVDKGETEASGQTKEPLIFVYEFTNVGSGDMLVRKVTTDCSCVSQESPADPIPPGRTGTVKLAYLAEDKAGEVMHRAVVETNDVTDRTVVLTAMVDTGERPWKTEPNSVEMGRIVGGIEYSPLLRFFAPDETWRVKAVESGLEGIDVRCREVDRKAIREVLGSDPKGLRFAAHYRLLQLRVLASPGQVGARSGELRLHLDGAPIKEVSVPFHAEVVLPVRVFPESIVLQGKEGDEIDESITLVSLTDDPISVDSARCGPGIRLSYAGDKSRNVCVRLRGRVGPNLAQDSSIQIVVDVSGRTCALAVPLLLVGPSSSGGA
jgi:hypothetical protein